MARSGIKVEALADACGCTRDMVYRRLNTDGVCFTVEQACAIAKLFPGVSYEYLFAHKPVIDER